MVYWKRIEGRNSLVITRSSEDTKLQATYFNKQDIANEMILWVGKTGSGKSVSCNQAAHKLKNNGYTVLYVSEKPGAEFDNAFCMFPQEDEVMLEILKRRNITPLPKEDCLKSAKLYHPYTFNIPTEKIPPIKFFTFPLDSLEDESIAALFDGDMKLQSFKAVKAGINELSQEEGVFDLIQNIGEKITDEDEDTPAIDEFFQELPMEGTINTRKAITSAFRGFLDHFFLAPSEGALNLDMLEILNDNKHMHFFSTKWITDKKLKVIFTIMLLRRIQTALSTGKVKHKVCIVLEEIKVLLPAENGQEFEKVLSSVIATLLSTIRTYAYVMATTQVYFATEKSFRNSCTEKFFGKLAEEDKEGLIKNHNFTMAKIAELNKLRKPGLFIRWDDLNTDEIPIISCPPPPFAIQQEGENFFQKFKVMYPGLLESYKDLKASMKESFEAQRARAKERYEQKFQKRKQDEEDAVALKEEKKEVQKLKKESVQDKTVMVRAVYDYVTSFEKEKGKLPSWYSVGRKFSLSDKTAKKYYEEYLAKVSSTLEENTVEKDEYHVGIL